MKINSRSSRSKTKSSCVFQSDGGRGARRTVEESEFAKPFTLPRHAHNDFLLSVLDVNLYFARVNYVHLFTRIARVKKSFSFLTSLSRQQSPAKVFCPSSCRRLKTSTP